MHALRHPDHRAALRVTMLAAALAIIVTLVLATSLSGLSTGMPSAGGRASVAATQATPGLNLLTGNPLTTPLGAHIKLPWPSPDRSAPTAR